MSEIMQAVDIIAKLFGTAVGVAFLIAAMRESDARKETNLLLWAIAVFIMSR